MTGGQATAVTVQALVRWPVPIIEDGRISGHENDVATNEFECTPDRVTAVRDARAWCQAEVRRQIARRHRPDRVQVDVTAYWDNWNEGVLFQSGSIPARHTGSDVIRWHEPTDHSGRPLSATEMEQFK